MQLGRCGLPALSLGVDRSRRLPDQTGMRAVGRRHRGRVAGPELVCIPADTLGGVSQILRVNPDRFWHGEPFCQLAIDATSGAQGPFAPIRPHQLTSAQRATQFVNCQ
jgi:hypothetical protein